METTSNTNTTTTSSSTVVGVGAGGGLKWKTNHEPKPQNFDSGKLSLRKEEFSKRNFAQCHYCLKHLNAQDLENHKMICPKNVEHQKIVGAYMKYKDNAQEKRPPPQTVYEKGAKHVTVHQFCFIAGRGAITPEEFNKYN